MLRIFTLLTGILVLNFFAGCKPAPASPKANEAKLSVTATNTILADAVENIGGDGVTVTSLVGPDGDPHTYEPSPADIKTVIAAKIYFENGLGFEPWSEKLYLSSGTQAVRVTTTKGIAPREMAAEGEKPGDHHETDPHVWNDVANFIKISENVRDAFVQADPAHAETYKANADVYLRKLRDLDGWVIQQVNTLPLEKRRLVTNHDVFGYFANRYQFEILGDALGSLSTESNDPSAAHIAQLVQAIKKTGVKTIFGDFSSNPKLISQIAGEAGVKIGPNLFVDSLGIPGSEGDTYEKMVRHNVSAIVENLK